MMGNYDLYNRGNRGDNPYSSFFILSTMAFLK